MSDEEDFEFVNTRPKVAKVFRSTAVNINSGRVSSLQSTDLKHLENLKIFSFSPDETPLLSTQLGLDQDFPDMCGINFLDKDTGKSSLPSLSNDTLSVLMERICAKELSFNNFLTANDTLGKGHILIVHSSKKRDWKKQLFRFLELANENFKFPSLFSVEIDNSLLAIGINEGELLQVLLQFSSNSYLHRLRLYTNERKVKKALDKIVDTIQNHQRKIKQISPGLDSEIYNTWRTANNSYPSPVIYSPRRLQIDSAPGFIKAAMYELKELWRAKESLLLKQFSKVYREYGLNKRENVNSKVTDSLLKAKDNYALVDLQQGGFLARQSHTKTYQYGYDGARFLELKQNNDGKIIVAPDTQPINNLILVSDDTRLMNDQVLYNSVKDIEIDQLLPEYEVKLVQGVPGCGKTTYILGCLEFDDLVLFPTREGATDFRSRIKEKYPNRYTKLKDSCRTIHSFIINSTQHLKTGGTYRRLIVDEALMPHAGEVLFAAALARVKEIMLIGDKHQIPFINRNPKCNALHHDILNIAETSTIINHTYRCPVTIAKLLSNTYEGGMTSSNHVSNELEKLAFENITTLPIDKEKHQILVFKQSEKHELIKFGFNANTIHEFQGKQAAHIAVVRMSEDEDDIYNSNPHCLVAVTRHTESFTYISTAREDLLSKWIRYSKQYTTEELNKHLKQALSRQPFLEHSSMRKERDK